MDKENPNILIAEDEYELREICSEALQASGYNVFEASNGIEALNILQEKDIALVLSDIRMPEMDGIQLLNQIVMENIDVDFIIITGFGSIDTAVETIKKGAIDYLPKPFNIDHLRLQVDKAINQRLEREEKNILDKRVQVLKLSQDLNKHLELNTLLDEFLFHIEKNFSPSSTGIFLKADQSNELKQARASGKLLYADSTTLNIIRKLCKETMEKQHYKLIDPYTIKKDAYLYSLLRDSKLNYSMLFAPILKQEACLGVVVLMRDNTKSFYTNDDLQLLKVFTSQTASAIENAKLYGQLQVMNQEIIRSLTQAVEAKDIYTRGHSYQVANYATQLGKRLGLTSGELSQLYYAGLVHDIGKIGIPDNILNKPDTLTPEEYSIMKRHPELGKNILLQVKSLENILPIIYHHHEYVDGNGYPDKLRDSQIPFLAKLISLVDAFDALTSDRAYRYALSVPEALSIIQAKAGQQWDTELIEIWVDIVNKENPKVNIG